MDATRASKCAATIQLWLVLLLSNHPIYRFAADFRWRNGIVEASN